MKEVVEMKKIVNEKIVTNITLITFIVSAIYVIIKLFSAQPVNAEYTGVAKEMREKSDYVLMLLQCMLGIFAMLLPELLKHKFKISIPSLMIIIFAIFLICAIYLGEVHSFYYLIPHWDTMLHIFSGAALTAVGFSIIGILNKSETVPVSLSPIFIAIFAFCFSMSLAGLWEIYEFLADSILGTNMQKFALESGELLVGHEAIVDTMKDMIVAAIGSIVMTVVGYVSIKNKKQNSLVDNMQLGMVNQNLINN